ncbi:MAG: 2Fe-2S iron-sulfur cluster-binding protein [Puniceicoccales bacterium]
MPKVTFQKSNVSEEWDPEAEFLLNFGESKGIDLDFGCRAGSCTMCQQPLVSGEVEYPDGHASDPDPGNVLLCCSQPKTDIVLDA